MAGQTTVVDGVIEVASAPERGVARTGEPTAAFLRVRFRSGQVGLLDMSLPRSTVWAEVLQSLRDTGQPAYVTVDPETGVITELLLPQALTVESITPAPDRDGVQVNLMISHARHFLQRGTPRYDEILRALETARKRKETVLVTETLDTHEIIDVRPFSQSRKTRRR
jgi:hypothetical protein